MISSPFSVGVTELITNNDN